MNSNQWIVLRIYVTIFLYTRFNLEIKRSHAVAIYINKDAYIWIFLIRFLIVYYHEINR